MSCVWEWKCKCSCIRVKESALCIFNPETHFFCRLAFVLISFEIIWFCHRKCDSEFGTRRGTRTTKIWESALLLSWLMGQRIISLAKMAVLSAYQTFMTWCLRIHFSRWLENLRLLSYRLVPEVSDITSWIFLNVSPIVMTLIRAIITYWLRLSLLSATSIGKYQGLQVSVLAGVLITICLANAIDYC